MTTILLIAGAIAIPLLLLFPMLGAEAGGPDRDSRGWRAIKRVGSLVSLMLSATFVVFGILTLVKAVGASYLRWSGFAISLFLITEGVRTAILFFPTRGPANSKQLATSYTVRAFGYFAITVLLVVAAFIDSWWSLIFAALSTWTGAMSVHIARKHLDQGGASWNRTA